jgi:hypothetical protein
VFNCPPNGFVWLPADAGEPARRGSAGHHVLPGPAPLRKVGARLSNLCLGTERAPDRGGKRGALRAALGFSCMLATSHPQLLDHGPA